MSTCTQIAYLVFVGSETEMFDSLSGVLGTSKEQGVASGWSSECELIQSQSLTTSCNDASTGGGSKSERSNAELWDNQKAVVIGNGADDNDRLVV